MKLTPLERELMRQVLPWRRVRWAIIQWRIARAKSYLWKHDIEYRMHVRTSSLIRAREEARSRGIGPLDPEYPEFDISGDK